MVDIHQRTAVGTDEDLRTEYLLQCAKPQEHRVIVVEGHDL